MSKENGYVIVTVSGKDRPGITASLTRMIVDHGVEIVDIDQAVLHDFLGLSFLLDMTGKRKTNDSVLKDLLFEAHRLQMTLNFQPFSEGEIPQKRDRNLFVLTFFGGTGVLAEMATILSEETANIQKISNLSADSARCIELVIDVRRANVSRLKRRLMQRSHELDIDLAWQKMEAYRKSKRIVFFDMDRTLIDMEVIDEMARLAGVYNEVARVTEKAMRGDIDFEDSLIRLPGPGLYRIRGVYRGWDGMTTDLEGRTVRISRKLGLENVFTGEIRSEEALLEVGR